MIELVWLVPVFPALGVIINGLLGKKYIKDKAHYVGVGSVALSLIFALLIFFEVILKQSTTEVILFQWILADDLMTKVGFLVDPLSAIMLFVVTGVGFLVHVYSVGYMHGDPGYPRYFAFLNLFMFSMLILILANNYLLMFVGWEAVGLCSYLLIGFWFEKKSAADAGKKAFIVNRIGDAGFLIGMFLIFVTFKTFDFSKIFPNAHGIEAEIATAITLALFIGATGKSAQIPLYTWLPDAMEGPTPVSALIHAATMVTAGVYMVARSGALYIMAPVSMEVVAVVGGLTAFLAATMALAQYDIKRVMAYSTVSQLGYMFLGLGVGAFSAGIFHLMTHAFFKGLLFLGAGSVIHGLSGEQDMRRMGGLRHHLPKTAITLYIAALALSGIPPFAGFWSKDEILAQAFKSGHYVLWGLATITAFMTAFYAFRMIYMTFYGQSRADEHAAHHAHESPGIMTVPLIILAVLSMIGGIIPGFPPEKGWIQGFLGTVLVGGHGESPGVAEAHVGLLGLSYLDWGLMLLSVVMALAGWMLARYFYTRRLDLVESIVARVQPVHRLFYHKWWVDEIYDFFVVKPLMKFSDWLWWVDARVIDGAVNGSSYLTVLYSYLSSIFDTFVVDGSVNGIGEIFKGGGGRLRRIQTGLVQNYALAMVVGIFVIVSLYLFV